MPRTGLQLGFKSDGVGSPPYLDHLPPIYNMDVGSPPYLEGHIPLEILEWVMPTSNGNPLANSKPLGLGQFEIWPTNLDML
jgi:hypothetical protein